jgi:hypothetical protein
MLSRLSRAGSDGAACARQTPRTRSPYQPRAVELDLGADQQETMMARITQQMLARACHLASKAGKVGLTLTVHPGIGPYKMSFELHNPHTPTASFDNFHDLELWLNGYSVRPK